MLPRARLSIRAKLALLAGMPLLGALLLAFFVANDTRQRAASAASLGSIEDLARLTSYIADLLHGVQDERAASAIAAGAPTPRGGEYTEVLPRVRGDTDAAARRLEEFLANRDRHKLPARLAGGLVNAEAALGALPALRASIDDGNVELQVVLEGYGALGNDLVGATAALAELTDDGVMLRDISATVALLELEERTSIEHAVVGNAAARGDFPPGAFKALVSTTTEEDVYDKAFRTSAADDVRRAFVEARQRGGAARAMLAALLESTEDTVSLGVAAWNEAAGRGTRELRAVEGTLLARIGTAAAVKAAELRSTMRLSLGVSLTVVLLSIAIGAFVGRGVRGSVEVLTSAAEKVRLSGDFSVRARRVSDDELGMLTETFNEMLTGIQSRDAELERHRSHLESLVVERTQQLATRNAALRLVLDNVEQGLATIGPDGTLHAERSAAFDRWFGASTSACAFYDALSPADERLRKLLQLGWAQVVDGFLPTEVAIEQLPRRFEADGRQFTLELRPIMADADVAGALLVVSDVTAELEARREHARQREEIQVFRRLARDKAAFLAFLEEMQSLVGRLRVASLDAHEQLNVLHTIKGNAGQYDVRSVADLAHGLESTVVDAGAPLASSELAPLFEAWGVLVSQVSALVGPGEAAVEVSRGELERIVERVLAGAPAAQTATRLRMLLDDPVATRLARLAEHAERLAVRLGKPAPTFTVDTDDLRLPRGRYAAFWAALVHVVRNAVDHGFEDAGLRTAAGKPACGHLALRARLEAGSVVVEIADDGAGIDWERLAERARAAGVPAGTRSQLERAIFTAGVSSAESVTQLSGRGVGLAAVWDATVALGGTVRVASVRGKETRFVFRLPVAGATTRTAIQGEAS
ncbi:MAG TPA: nitrate- and nitrite sensing domain-containing protein [Polyangiaceae bacterium]|nr:nitrate- and nitrite sensing domain-containing protein [Polyangiaceae bacterium]